MQKQALQPFDGVLARGYGAAPVCLRLRVAAAEGGPLFLRVRPAYLDAVTLYDPLQGAAPVSTLGDRQPRDAQADPSTVLLFRLPPAPAPRDVWLRVATTRTRLVYAEVLDEAALRHNKAFIEHAGAFYLGVMGLRILWGMVNALLQPDGLNASFLG